MTEDTRALLGVLLAVRDPGRRMRRRRRRQRRRRRAATATPPSELTPIKVGILPLSGLAPLWYGIEQGYFEDEGLDVTTEIGEGGAALTPAVLNNDYQFAIGEYVSIMQARENNVGIQVVSNLTNGADEPDQGINALLVKADSGIDSVEDLAGKTIAVNGLGGVDDVTIKAILDDNGVDPAERRVHRGAVPRHERGRRVRPGRRRLAARAVRHAGRAGRPGQPVLDPYYEAIPSMPLGLVFGSEEWLADNPDLANGLPPGAAALDRGVVRRRGHEGGHRRQHRDRRRTGRRDRARPTGTPRSTATGLTDPRRPGRPLRASSKRNRTSTP